MMNSNSVLLAAVAASICSLSFADQLSVSIDGFGDPTNFNITDQHLDLRVTKLVPAQGTNTSTHILIEGLSPIEEGTLNYASTYSGINVDTGVAQDTGVLYLKMPEGSQLPTGTVASPIVGVVQRQGDWPTLDFPLTVLSAAGGNTPEGLGDYDGSTLVLALDNGETTYSSNPISYSVLDTDTVVLSAFTLSPSVGADIPIGESMLIRDGNRFFGTLTNMDPNASYDSLIFTIDLTNIPDLDGDTIPDFSDPVVSEVLVQGEWILHPNLGYVWGATPSIGYSTFMGWFSIASYPVLYHFELGWLQVMMTPDEVNPGYWFHSPTLGWIYAEAAWDGIFFHYSTVWTMNNFKNPNS